MPPKRPQNTISSDSWLRDSQLSPRFDTNLSGSPLYSLAQWWLPWASASSWYRTNCRRRGRGDEHHHHHQPLHWLAGGDDDPGDEHALVDSGPLQSGPLAFLDTHGGVRVCLLHSDGLVHRLPASLLASVPDHCRRFAQRSLWWHCGWHRRWADLSCRRHAWLHRRHRSHHPAEDGRPSEPCLSLYGRHDHLDGRPHLWLGDCASCLSHVVPQWAGLRRYSGRPQQRAHGYYYHGSPPIMDRPHRMWLGH